MINSVIDACSIGPDHPVRETQSSKSSLFVTFLINFQSTCEIIVPGAHSAKIITLLKQLIDTGLINTIINMFTSVSIFRLN